LTQSSEHWFRIRIYKNTFDCHCPS